MAGLDAVEYERGAGAGGRRHRRVDFVLLNDADACVGVGLWPRQYHKGPEGGRGSARQDCDNRVAVDTHYISPWVDYSTEDTGTPFGFRLKAQGIGRRCNLRR